MIPMATQPQTSLLPCPTCSGPMHWKQNRTSQSWFMGCQKWPRCVGTRNEEGVPTGISPANQQRFIQMLKASVMRSEDECLVFSKDDMEKAEQFDLHLEEITEERSYVLTVRAK